MAKIWDDEPIDINCNQNSPSQLHSGAIVSNTYLCCLNAFSCFYPFAAYMNNLAETLRKSKKINRQIRLMADENMSAIKVSLNEAGCDHMAKDSANSKIGSKFYSWGTLSLIDSLSKTA